MVNNIEFFHFRGGIDYKRLSLIHKVIMAMLKMVISKKDLKKLLNDDREFLATYGGKIDFTDKNTIALLVELIK